MKDLLSTYTEIKECDYKGRHYSVRDNGAIFRHPKEGCKPSKLDNIWTFGKKDLTKGYMVLSTASVHRIVATAYHGNPKDPKLVVDHIDTNKCNNRPENLRWLTRLENVLNNPTTRSRIEAVCGSVEAFLKDPSILRKENLNTTLDWMRTVSKEEAEACLIHLERWKQEDKKIIDRAISKGIGEWIYKKPTNPDDNGFGEPWDVEWASKENNYDRQRKIEEHYQREYEYRLECKDSLTPRAKQVEWRIKTAFPLCPSEISSNPLQDYFANLKKGEVFCYNDTYESLVHKAEMSDDGTVLGVITYGETIKVGGGYALAIIRYQDGYFIHENKGTFFEEIGAEKDLTLELGREWTGGDVFDDFCS